jgi:hypothetical protein
MKLRKEISLFAGILIQSGLAVLRWSAVMRQRNQFLVCIVALGLLLGLAKLAAQEYVSGGGDNQNPTISSVSADDSTVELKTSSQTQTVTFTAVVSDNVAISSVSLPGTTSTGSSGDNYTFTKLYSYGDYSFGNSSETLTLTVTDTAGNIKTDTVDVVVSKTDNQIPVIISFSADDTSVHLFTSSQTQTVTFTAVVSDNVAISSVSLPGTTSTGSSGDNYTFTKSYSYGDYSFGNSSETLTLTVTDTAGNTKTDTVDVVVSKTDNQSPVIISFSADDTSVHLFTSSRTQTVTFTAVVSDNVAISSVSLPGTTYSGVSGSTYTWTKEYDYDDYNFGSNTDSLTLTVTDTAGNTTTDAVDVVVSKTDDQNPVMLLINPSFEADAVNSGGAVHGSMTGWTAAGLAGNQEFSPGNASQIPKTIFGEQHAYTNGPSASGPASLSQLTPLTITAGGTYTLTVDVGQVSNYSNSQGTIRLFGNTLGLGTALSNSNGTAELSGITPPNQSTSYLVNQTITYTALASGDPFEGQQLGVILIGSSGLQVLYDNVRLEVIAPNTFANWIDGNDVGALTGFSDDADGDNLSNGLEAWFGTHPGQFTTGLANISTVGNTTTFSHPQNTTVPDDLTGYYEWSPNLTDWYAGDGADGPPSGTTVTIVPNATGTTTTVTATISGAADRIFLRARVSQN